MRVNERAGIGPIRNGTDAHGKLSTRARCNSGCGSFGSNQAGNSVGLWVAEGFFVV